MRFERIDLTAFGHFTRRSLEFGTESGRFHLIYGANEAGKSTALRAIRGLLFGIEQQSADVYLHAGKDLRIGGVLWDEARQKRWHVVRRKGRKNTLMAPDGTALDEACLEPFLGGIDERLFSSMFGLNHETLRSGAQALLQGEGRLGESLFSAGSGLSAVRRLLAELNEQADQLYTPKARSRRLNQEINDVREARQLVQHSSTTASAYLQQEARLAELNQRLAALTAERTRHQAHKHRLERALRILPLIAQRRTYLEQLQALKSLVEVPAELPAVRQEALTALQHAQRSLEHEVPEIERVERRMQSLQVPEALLTIDEPHIVELHQRLGSHRKALLDLPRREAELVRIREDVLAQLRALGHEPKLELAQRLQLDKLEATALRRLSGQKSAYEGRLSENKAKLTRVEEGITRKRKEVSRLAAPREVEALARSHARAQHHVELERSFEQAKRRLTASERELDERLRRLPGFEGGFTELAALRCPLQQTIDGFERRFTELLEGRRQLRLQLRRLYEQRVELEQRLQAAQAEGEVARPERLAELRTQRDTLLAQCLLTPDEPEWGDPKTPFGSLLRERLGRLRDSIDAADVYSDRLRAEAQRVALFSTIQSELEAVQRRRQLLEEQLEEAQRTWQAAQSEWEAVWPAGVEVRTPREMREWLTQRAEVLAVAERVELDRAEVRRHERALADVIAELNYELRRVGEPDRTLWESLTQLLQRVAGVVEAERLLRRQREELEQRLSIEEQQREQLQHELTDLQVEHKQWRAEWLRQVRRIGLSKDATAEEVSLMLEGLAEVRRKLDEARGLERRIGAIRRDVEQFESEVNKLLQRTAPELLERSVDEATELLVASYRRAQQAAEERRRLERELREREQRVTQAQSERDHAAQQLEALARQLGARDQDELAHLIEQARRRSELRELVAAEERRLVAQGEGASLATLLEETRGLDADEVRARIAELEAQLQELQLEWETLTTERAAVAQGLSRLTVGAASAAEELSARVAKLRSTVGRYLRMRLAADLLAMEIERYRQAHQGPILGRADELFPRLTLNRYQGLRAGFDAKDQPVLLCVAEDGREVPVERLSDGTRDQLYLALRLASLERYFETSQRMPLIFDDILIHFDDERAAAALELLGELSEQTQVLFFTHHRRLVELAGQVIAPERLVAHQLSAFESGRHAAKLEPMEAG